MRYADGGGIQYAWMLYHRFVDFPGGDIFAAFYDDFLGPADHIEKAIVVPVPYVAGTQPSIGSERGPCSFWVFVIAAHHGFARKSTRLDSSPKLAYRKTY